LRSGEGEQLRATQRSQLPQYGATQDIDDALAGERHELHVAPLPRLETHRGACRDVEPHAAGASAVELQRRIGLEEMIVRADLDRPIARIGNRQRHRLATGIELDLAVHDEHLSGDHHWYLATLRC